MTTAVIVQARLGSTRLPRKVTRDLGGEPILKRVLQRARQIPADVHVLAVPHRDLYLLAPATSGTGFDIFSSECAPEYDVLRRFRRAVAQYEPGVIVRITADCPLIDPDVCAKVIRLRRQESAAYASNVHPRSFPQGLDCEVFTREALERADREATDPYDREHVTPFMVRNERRVNLASGRFDLAPERWTLDYPEDLEFLRAIWAVREPGGMDDVLAILDENPQIRRINAARAA